MVKKHLVLMGLTIGTVLIIISTFFYPGGTYENFYSEGYDWVNNYISNLLRPMAVNGKENPARPIAIFGVLFLTASFGLFFVKFSKKIKIKSASRVIKYLGITVTILGSLTVFPRMHDIMVTLSSILTLLIFFYITVMVIKSKQTFLKVMSIIFLLIFYCGAFMYFSRFHLEYMPLMQKSIFIIKITWVLSLEYLTGKKDFEVVLN